jgi:hypothetical protein
MPQEKWKPQRGLPILELYAWIVTESDGGEGVAAFTLPGIGTMPLVGADMERIASLREWAEKIRKETGFPVRLVHFGTRDVIEELP